MTSVDDLTVPRDSSTTRALLSRALKRAAQDLLSLRHPALDAVRGVAAQTLRTEPGRLLAILRRPNVGAPIRILRQRDDPAIARQLAATLAVELAASGAPVPTMTFEDLPERVACLGGRFALPGGTRATLEDGVWRAEGHDPVSLDAPTDRPYHPIARGLVLAMFDDNPLAMDEAHPDKAGNALDLGGHGVDAWTARLGDALDRIERYLPVIREEASLVLSQVVPVGFDEHAHLSASYAEAIGTIYLSLHPDPMTMTEAVIHELGHNKVNALAEQGPLLENAWHPLYASPVRPDPRPLMGVLLAVHAFLPVEALYRAMADAGDPLSLRPGFARRRAEVEKKNREGAAVLLEHGVATSLGRGVLDEIERLVAAPTSAAR